MKLYIETDLQGRRLKFPTLIGTTLLFIVDPYPAVELIMTANDHILLKGNQLLTKLS